MIMSICAASIQVFPHPRCSRFAYYCAGHSNGVHSHSVEMQPECEPEAWMAAPANKNEVPVPSLPVFLSLILQLHILTLQIFEFKFKVFCSSHLRACSSLGQFSCTQEAWNVPHGPVLYLTYLLFIVLAHF